MVARPLHARREVESEGMLRILVLALALAMPLMTLAFLQIQNLRMNYQMSEVREKIQQQEELQRKLLLERSRFQRDEEVEAYAVKTGMQPKRQSHLINRSFSPQDQRLAKSHPVSSEGFFSR